MARSVFFTLLPKLINKLCQAHNNEQRQNRKLVNPVFRIKAIHKNTATNIPKTLKSDILTEL